MRPRSLGATCRPPIETPGRLSSVPGSCSVQLRRAPRWVDSCAVASWPRAVTVRGEDPTPCRAEPNRAVPVVAVNQARRHLSPVILAVLPPCPHGVLTVPSPCLHLPSPCRCGMSLRCRCRAVVVAVFSPVSSPVLSPCECRAAGTVLAWCWRGVLAVWLSRWLSRWLLPWCSPGRALGPGRSPVAPRIAAQRAFDPPGCPCL